MIPSGIRWVKSHLLLQPDPDTEGDGVGGTGESPGDDGLGDYQHPSAHPIVVQELTPAQFVALLAKRANAT